MTRLARMIFATCLLGFGPVAADTVTAVDDTVAPAVTTDGVAEMKWEKVGGIPYPCQAGDQICVCMTGSDVIDCRHPIPIVKSAD